MTADKTHQKGSDLLVRALENEGVERVFAVPGEENLDVLESLRTSTIELVLMRHEQPAAFMAATYGRLTGKPGVVLTTLGPGATNLTTGAAYAQLGGMPMVMITGQKPILSAPQAQFQIVDIVGMMKPLTKLAQQIVSTAMIPTMVRNAFRIAAEERPGAVHLELPEDIAATAADEPLVAPHPEVLPIAADEVLDTAAARILAASRPLVMIGAAANRNRLVPSLSRFIARTRLPFFNTQMGKGAVDGAGELYLGTAALSEDDYVHDAIDKADLILSIGHDTIEKPPFLMTGSVREVVHLGFTPANVEEVYFPQYEVIGDIAGALDRLGDRLDGKLAPDPGGLLGLREQIHAHVQEGSLDGRFPPLPQRIVHDVRQALPDDGVVTLDNGTYKIWFARGYRTHRANTILLDNALATMGAGLPSGMMAAMLDPGRKVIAVAGDGGFMMNSQELETAVRLRLNLVMLVLEDNSYGMIRWKQSAAGFPDWGLQFGNPDFVKYAEAYGATGTRVWRTEDLVPILKNALAEGGVHLVVCPIDYSENQRVLIDELRTHRAAGNN
ncbi:acetolactate synthase large subunit [Actinoplanes sp. TBRC 11911]|uniref:acetolactate synthase large subunit n=1 Tax=Actinoplanes sp. TBRC 11911 TaxID=2729386 RepID=UPI00145D0F01|nr:acetolactate synthase large subunit [Actinoplanes sp. TBRC 11911]NMO53687.1 acetolactate synthase large subunit [Actinoplanes sp. TBRC 11911]